MESWVAELLGNLEICVMNADGSAPTRLTNNAVGDYLPRWRP